MLLSSRRTLQDTTFRERKHTVVRVVDTSAVPTAVVELSKERRRDLLPPKTTVVVDELAHFLDHLGPEDVYVREVRSDFATEEVEETERKRTSPISPLVAPPVVAHRANSRKLGRTQPQSEVVR